MANAFEETRKLFRNYTNFSEPLTFEQWVRRPEGHKAAILYVQFYEQITLAWYKSKSFFVLEEDGVDTIMQYLMKNVPVIEANPKRFSKSYIYQVAYNCLYCISHDIRRDIDRYELETSNVVPCDDGVELDLFDSIMDNVDDVLEIATRARFWSIIESMGPETMKVVYHILNDTSLRKSVFRENDGSKWNLNTPEGRQAKESYMNRKKNYEIDPLKDISVSVSKMEEIIEELKVKLTEFKDEYLK